MPLTMSKFGEWTKAGIILQGMSVRLLPAFQAQLREDGEFILNTLRGHIDAQDLPWTPLSERTVEMKHGDETIYVETGFLIDNLQVRKVKSSKDNMTLFIGASPWKHTKEGLKLSDLMIWLEYGTDKIPPRPLIRPTWEEVEPILKNNWRELFSELLKTGGV